MREIEVHRLVATLVIQKVMTGVYTPRVGGAVDCKRKVYRRANVLTSVILYSIAMIRLQVIIGTRNS